MTKRISKFNSAENSYSAKEDQLIRLYFGKIHVKAIQKLLPHRTISAIYNRIRLLNLTTFAPGHNPMSRPSRLSLKQKNERLAQHKRYSKLYLRHKRKTDQRWTMFNNAKFRAKKLKLPFQITIQDIIVPKKCPIFNVPIRQGSVVTSPNSPSLDRKNPKLGYTKKNIWVISHRANKIKNDASIDELKQLIKALEKYL